MKTYGRAGVEEISSNKRSFRGPRGVGSGLDSPARAKICARELAIVVSRSLPLFRAAWFQFYSPIKRSFRGPGGVGRGLDSLSGALAALVET